MLFCFVFLKSDRGSHCKVLRDACGPQTEFCSRLLYCLLSIYGISAKSSSSEGVRNVVSLYYTFLLRIYSADFNEIWYSRCRRINVWRIRFCFKVTPIVYKTINELQVFLKLQIVAQKVCQLQDIQYIQADTERSVTFKTVEDLTSIKISPYDQKRQFGMKNLTFPRNHPCPLSYTDDGNKVSVKWTSNSRNGRVR